MTLFKKLHMLSDIDSAFEMALRVISSYNDKEMATMVIHDILESADEIVNNEEQAELYFDIILNIYDDKEVFRDPYFYKEILDELIKEYEKLEPYYIEYIKEKNLDLPISYYALVKLVSRKPEGDE